MPLAFTDNFNRGNGALGADWLVDAGSASIVSDQAVISSSGVIRPSTLPASPSYCQRLWVVTPTSFPKSIAVRLRADLAGANYYQITWTISATSISAQIVRRVSGVSVTQTSFALGFTWGATIDLMASIIDQQLLVWAESYLMFNETMPDLTTRGYPQIYQVGNSVPIEDYALYDLADAPLNVTVESGPDEDGAYVLLLVNGGADWTPGTPGLPVFTSRGGVISAQEITDESHATLTYLPSPLDSTTYLYDLQNDLYYPLRLTTDLLGVGGTGTGAGLTTTESATLAGLKTLLDALLAQGPSYSDFAIDLWGLVISTHSAYGSSSNAAIDDLLAAILADDGRLATIDAQSYSAMSVIGTVTNAGAWTLENVWQYVQGTGAKTIADVLDAIADIPIPSDLATQLTNILNKLAHIETTNTYTFGDVLYWITNTYNLIDAAKNHTDSIPTNPITSLTPVTDILTDRFSQVDDEIAGVDDHVLLIPTDPVRSLQPVEDAIDAHNTNLNNKATSILNAIAAIPTNPITDLSPVIDDIGDLSTLVGDKVALILAAIEALADLLTPKTAPVWPGVANVTLGQSHNLAPGLTITEAMDGVIIAITGYRTSEGFWTFDDRRSLRNAGGLSFFDDADHHEYHQNLGFQSAIYCPKAMRQAAGVRIRCAAQITGTATPWTINTI